MTAVLATPKVETAEKRRACSADGHVPIDIDITVDPRMTVQDAHEVASAVERNIERVAGIDAPALVHGDPAIPPHARPDSLFGDVQASVHESDERYAAVQDVDGCDPGDTPWTDESISARGSTRR